ncbi:MAG: putative exported protein [Polaromonas sp.]|jgi:tripartite-type tricarboxylate transporter receptor subunit TctC|nr:putative exported protein [Polaromonas sp.]
MKLQRRNFLAKSAVLLGSSLPGTGAFAQGAESSFPDRAITLIVPFPPGSNTDIASRIWGQIIGTRLDTPVVIDNRAGAGGNIGAVAVARAAPNGYSLLYSTASAYAINPAIYPSLPYKPQQDFSTIAVTILVPVVLVVAGDSPYRTWDDFAKAVKQNGDKLSYGSNGAGTSSHIGCKVVAKSLGQPELLHVPYKGGSQAVITDIIGGRLTYAMDSWAVVSQLVKSGRLRALAVSSKERLAVAPDVPSLTEILGRDTVVATWNAVWAPAKTPVAILDKVHTAIAEGRRDQALVTQFENQGTPLLPYMNRQQCEKFMQDETVRWKAIVNSVGIQV